MPRSEADELARMPKVVSAGVRVWIIQLLGGPSLTVACLLLMLPLVSAGCVSTYELHGKPAAGQEVVFISGREVLLSQKDALVAVSPATSIYQSSQRPVFTVLVLNATTAPFVFSTEDVSASVNGSPLKVFTYEELLEEVRRQMAWGVLAVGLSGMAQSMNAANAGYQYHYGTTNYSYYGSGLTGRGYGTYSGYTYDPGAAMRAQAQAQAQTLQNLQAVTAAGQSAEAGLAGVLRKQTIMPGYWHAGNIVVHRTGAPKPENELCLEITAVGQSHVFTFVQTKSK